MEHEMPFQHIRKVLSTVKTKEQILKDFLQEGEELEDEISVCFQK
jgi:hypothetical protein